MKLQYNTVELNIKQLNEVIQEYDKAYNYKDLLLCEILMGKINRIAHKLTESIKRGVWYSHDLILLNGIPRKNPFSFYVSFNRKN